MTSRWWLRADAAQVWPWVGQTPGWARWLRSMAPRASSSPGPEIAWRMPWPWAAAYRVLDPQDHAGRDFSCRLHGRLRTRWGVWVEPLPEQDGTSEPGAPGVDVTLRVEICLDRGWMRRLSPWLLPWLARQHFAAVRDGVPRLGKLLGCATGAPSEWSGQTRR